MTWPPIGLAICYHLLKNGNRASLMQYPYLLPAGHCNCCFASHHQSTIETNRSSTSHRQEDNYKYLHNWENSKSNHHNTTTSLSKTRKLVYSSKRKKDPGVFVVVRSASPFFSEFSNHQKSSRQQSVAKPYPAPDKHRK